MRNWFVKIRPIKKSTCIINVFVSHFSFTLLKFDGLTSVLPTIHPEGLKGRHHAVMRVAVDLTFARDPMQTKTPWMAGGILGNIHEEVLSNLIPVIEWRQAKLQRTPQEPKLDHLNDAWAPLQSTESGRTTRLTRAPMRSFLDSRSRHDLSCPLATEAAHASSTSVSPVKP